ncbi:hypothetical protein GCM10010910_01400 [Microbacterium nanhaiense]|uniref:Lipoprotein n=1 Tax=Microbacterium nanhaiense TaxID=1301026 RepID=A0ABQ2MX44_9MICO|nr:hypothetical protein [Microbacterium nanhaiense]GGO59140.1 hypothetical protein GCM10010910_01400 [Microbacterium nanhaiense]
MNRAPLTAIVLSALLLAGCSSAGEETPQSAPQSSTPTSTTNPNEAACAEFADATLDVGQAVVDSRADELDIPATYDEVALAANGDVKERILVLIDELPDPPHMIGWMDNREAYSDDVEAVARACEAEGFSIQVATLVAANG